MASHKSPDDSSSTPPARPIRRNASELDVVSLLTSPIDEGQKVVGMETASKISGMFDFANVDVSSMLTGISAAYKPNVMLDFAKLDVSSMLSSISRLDFSSMLSNPGTQSLLGNSDFLEELDELFTQLPEGETFLAEAADDLIPFISFEHNATVRRLLQLLIVFTFHTLLTGAYMIPFVAGPLSAYGTPNAKQTWKATGAAYDRLYGIKDYHPNKALENGAPPTHRSKAHRTTRH